VNIIKIVAADVRRFIGVLLCFAMHRKSTIKHYKIPFLAEQVLNRQKGGWI
jgi:hypothetical protein